MVLGKIRDTDIGHWLLTEDNRVVQLISYRGALLRVHTDNGRMYYPVHDIQRKLSDEDAVRMGARILTKANVKVHEKKEIRTTRQVIRTDANGNEEVFRTIKIAAQASNMSSSTVSNICNGKVPGFKGFSFRFKNGK